ncbi:MAG: hypothetical protein ACI8W8_002639 [Rhodothermales bacterium]|jgi:hypothetical protein
MAFWGNCSYIPHMTDTLTTLAPRVLALPARSRAVLAELLLETLDPPGPCGHETLELLRNRDQEMNDGLVATKSHAQIVRSAREALAAHR